MSFQGFSDHEIQKINRNKKLDVKVAKKIPTHKIMKRDENSNNISHVESNKIDKIQTGQELIQESINEHSTKSVVDAVVVDKIEIAAGSDENVLGDKNDRLFQGVSLQDFEFQRKLMEEQNKMKRNLLQQAISKYTQKTKDEAQKFFEIKSALDKLDSELASDVNILRKEIESATFNYNSIEKHYSSIEREFLKAKKDFFLAQERKEMLTEHLCTIIAHNEDRKAKKLSELMEKVGLNLNEKMNDD